MRYLVFTLSIAALMVSSNESLSAAETRIIDFEELPLNGGSFVNGNTAGQPLPVNFTELSRGLAFEGEPFETLEISQQWTSKGTGFSNTVLPAFGSWSGWSWSNVQDSTTPGFTNQYAAFPGGGANNDGSVDLGGIYAITSSGGYIDLPANAQLLSLQLANATYAATYVGQGSTNFGGPFVNGDFFEATITGFDLAGGINGGGSVLGSTLIPLADFRNGQNFLLRDWQTLDSELQSLSGASSLEFSFADSRNGAGTPFYLAIDNLSLSVVPEPGSVVLLSSVIGLFSLRRRRNSV